MQAQAPGMRQVYVHPGTEFFTFSYSRQYWKVRIDVCFGELGGANTGSETLIHRRGHSGSWSQGLKIGQAAWTSAVRSQRG